jgi:glycogen debranching enzyme
MTRKAPTSTALQHICELITPDPLVNQAFLYAKDNLARCMRWYSLGWGMSNAPHDYTIVVGRDTGWMCIGTDYIAPWFAPAALKAFRDRQKPNGQILEFIDMESGRTEDYGLNMADNTPFYLWAVSHHWQQFHDPAFRQDFLPSARAAAEYLLAEVDERGLLNTRPAGVETRGISSWRNIIAGAVIAGEVTEINALAVQALRLAADFAAEPRYAAAADGLAAAINEHLWVGDRYALNFYEGQLNPQATGDLVFPIFTGVASTDQAASIFERLAAPDFWTRCGLRTVPNSDPAYHPTHGYGLVGGSWPNLTLWYAAAIAPHDPDRALEALRMVARPVVESDHPTLNAGEFAEWFHGDDDSCPGMPLSPWVAPTYIWAILEGLLGLVWRNGLPTFAPHWPQGWDSVQIKRLPSGRGPIELDLKK